MTVYLIFRGSLLVIAEETLAGAEARQASESGTRVVVRRGIHRRWCDRTYWRYL